MDKSTIINIVGVLIICSILVSSFIFLGGLNEKKSYVVGIVDDQLPNTAFISENYQRTPTGFDVEAVRWIAEKEGFEITFKEVPWSIIPQLLEKGDIDMFFSGYTITPERAEYVDFTDPYYKTNLAVVIRQDSGFTPEMFYQGNLTIGTHSGTTAEDSLEKIYGQEGYTKMVEDGQINLYVDKNDAFGKSLKHLDAGEVDALVYNDVTMNYYLSTRTNLTVLTTIDTEEYYGVAVKKGNNELKNILNKGLQNFKASENRSVLLDKYHMKETLE